MKEMDGDEFMTLFISEMKNFLKKLDVKLKKYENEIENIDVANEIFETVRSTREMALTMGFPKISKLIYEAENLLDNVINRKIKSDEKITGILFIMHDYLEKFIDSITNGKYMESEDIFCCIMEKMHKTINKEAAARYLIEPNREENNDDIGSEAGTEIINEIKSNCEEIYKLTEKLEKNKEETTIKLIIRGFHSIRSLAGLSGSMLIYEVAEKTEEMFGRLAEAGGKTKIEQLKKLILNSCEIIDYCTGNIEGASIKEVIALKNSHLKNLEEDFISETENFSDRLVEHKIGKIFIEKGTLTEDEVIDIMVKQKDKFKGMKFGEIAVKEKKIGTKELEDALNAQKTKNIETPQNYFKISAQKYDNLTEMIDEIMVIQSQIEKYFVTDNENAEMMNDFFKLSKIVRDAHTLSISLRRVSLENIFQKLNRIAKDTVSGQGKKINVEFSGEEIEIDKEIVDKLSEPLMHLVRNSIAHGIETKEERIKSGKKEEGLIRVQASSKIGNVEIKVMDDGQGINTEKVLNKALEKGMIKNRNDYTKKEIENMIFMPGLSTAENVDSVSGRGVGMDVVKTEISRLGGKIEIINREGEGCTFILRIPVHSAAINGTMVEIEKQKYIIPTAFIKEIIVPENEGKYLIKNVDRMIKVRDKMFQLIDISDVFGINKKVPVKNIVILESGDKISALPVGNILGRTEIVVKSLDSQFEGVDFISGASIMSDGNISLVLNVENLLYKI